MILALKLLIKCNVYAQLIIYNLDSKNKNNHFITVLYIPISANNAPITQNKLNG